MCWVGNSLCPDQPGIHCIEKYNKKNMVQNCNKNIPIGMMWFKLRSSCWLYCTEKESRDTTKH